MKIDLVYLWVDGSDLGWQEKKTRALQDWSGHATRRAASSAVAAQRWQDHDELKYALRSVDKFLPWINHVYIVTDGQTPRWLNTDNPRVSIVDHAAIIPPEHRPSFNSEAIERCIHKIPGLSEYFLHANDDMFFGRPLTPDFFFDDAGRPIVILKERNNARAFRRKQSWGNWKQTKWNALNFIHDKFGLKYHLTFKHAVEPKRKSWLAEHEASFGAEIFQPSMTPFRDRRNVQRMVFPMLDNALGRNRIVLNWRLGDERIEYDVHKDSTLRRTSHALMWLLATVFGSIRYDCYDKQWRITRFIGKYRPAMFAINDQGGAFSSAAMLLGRMFPEPSSFEK